MDHDIALSTDAGHEVLRYCEVKPPNFVVVGSGLSDMNWTELPQRLATMNCCPVIVVLEPEQYDRAKTMIGDRMTGMIITPVTSEKLRPALYVTHRRFEQMQNLDQQIQELRSRVYPIDAEIN